MQNVRGKSVSKWMSCGMERLSLKLERLKPRCNGYNRIQPILLSKSVTRMLNNPLPSGDQIGGSNVGDGVTYERQNTKETKDFKLRNKGVLSISESEWEEVYPTVNFRRYNDYNRENEFSEKPIKFAYYRNCSTRIT